MELPGVSVRKVLLSSSDNQAIEVPRDVIALSSAINIMLIDMGFDEGTEMEEPLAVKNVRADVLRKIIQWCTYHRDDPPEDDEEHRERRSDDLSQWDIEFMKMEKGLLFELLIAADQLEIKGLLDCGCKTVANMIKEKTNEEIREEFGIRNDITPQEEEAFRKEAWWDE